MPWLFERCILAPLNETTRTINTTLVAQLLGEPVEYRSLDSVLDESQVVHFLVEFFKLLRGVRISFVLALIVPIIILCSLDPPRVTIDTRCIITKVSGNTIEARISHGRYAGHDIIIPRIPLIPSNSTLPFEFRYLQFSITLCFPMTINKAKVKLLKL